MTKFLAPASVKVELLTASVCLEYASFETNKIYGYKIQFFHVDKLTTLASLQKVRIKYPFL